MDIEHRCRGVELEVLRAVVVQWWCRAGAEPMLVQNAAGAGKQGAGKGGVEVVRGAGADV